MKKILLMFVAILAVAFTSCNKSEELVFDHELPQFELKEGAILLEVLMPAGTAQDDELYIVGEFNGGEATAVGQLQWQLEPSANQHKWGIYLYPESFVEGKTLADGYYFYSKQDGKERTVKNEDILHYETANPGERVNNIMVSRWESYFLSEGPAIEHDGYVVYVIDETSWGGALAMYAWGDKEAFGGWPGMQPTGQEVVADVMYTYFDLGEANTGLNLNLIFNNNGGGSQLADYNVTVNQDFFLRLTDDGVELLEGEPLPETDGYAIFVDNQAGWEGIALYVWGGALGNDGLGGWPGMQPTGTWSKKGVTYTYFDLGAANNGKDGNFILNNNNGGSQTADIALTMDKHHFYRIFADNTFVEVDPENPEATPTPEPEPEPEPQPGVAHKIYVNNQSGWSPLSIYAYGDAEVFGGWPGQAEKGTETIDGVEYVWFETAAEFDGKSVTIIFNNGVGGEGGQFDGPTLTLDKDYYFNITSSTCEEVVKETPAEIYNVYVQNNSDWNPLYLYAWGDGAAQDGLGGWPGMQQTEVVTVNGVEYYRFEMPAAVAGTTMHLIFNNGVGGEGGQFDGPVVEMTKDYYFTITNAGFEEVATGGFAIYVANGSGWNPLYLYSWGDGAAQDCLGGWPGAAQNEVVAINGEDFCRFDIPDAAIGTTMHLIFNNGVGGEGGQFDGPVVEFTGNLYYRITATSFEEVQMN